jgi:hypothetical protein
MEIIRKKETVMKKILSIIILAIMMTSCYKDYVTDYNYNAIYFPYQTDVRTLVVGEGMTIQVGVDLSGVRANTIDRPVTFTNDNTLVTPAILATMKTGANYIKNSVTSVTTLLPLPSNYFTLSNSNTMVIKAGQHMGYVTLTVDSAKFLSDPLTLNANYAIPFYITTAKTDSILPDKRYTVIGLKYENMLFGNYWHGGATTYKLASGKDTVVKYYMTIPNLISKTWTLKTVAPNALITNGFSDQTQSAKPGGEMMLTLNGTNVTISSVAGSTQVILPDGASTFNKPKLLQDRKLFLSYKWVNGTGVTYYVKDTLFFLNRIRDGINEWQDENPSHY